MYIISRFYFLDIGKYLGNLNIVIKEEAWIYDSYHEIW